jgi:Ran GTPase-activating protein (RanGAP) involved in mRNA processing and transport
VQVLVLDYNKLLDEGMVVLANGLHACPSLTQLSVAHCGFAATGAKALADILRPSEKSSANVSGPKLQFLNVSGNQIGAEGLLALCPRISTAMSLISLGLRDIGIGNTHEDVHASGQLAGAAVASPQLQHLDFSGNHLGMPKSMLLIKEKARSIV